MEQMSHHQNGNGKQPQLDWTLFGKKGSGSVSPLDKFANTLLEMTKKKTSTTTQSNVIAGACCGFFYMCNNDFEGRNKIELQFYDKYDAIVICPLRSSILDVMEKARGVVQQEIMMW